MSVTFPGNRRTTRTVVNGLLVLAVALLGACGAETETGAPVEVHWGHDTCERCQMTISDKRFATVVRVGGQEELHRFDDLGCAVLWMEDSDVGGIFQLWARDVGGNGWLEGVSAFYVPGQKTPMGYGWGATSKETEESVGFVEAAKRIRERERKGTTPPEGG